MNRVFLSALMLSIAIFGVTFGLYFFLGGIAETNIRNTLYAQQESIQTKTTKEFSDHIASDLEGIVLRLELLARNNLLQDEQQQGSIFATALLKETADEIAEISAVDAIDILDKDNVVVNGYTGESRKFIGVDRSELPVVITVRNTLESYVSGVGVGADGRHGLAIGVPIISQSSGSYVGTIMVEIPAEDFFGRYGNLLNLNEQTIIALDRDGNYLTADLQQFVGKNFFGQEVQQFTGGDQQIYRMYEDVIKFGKPAQALFTLTEGGERLGTAQPVMFRNGQVMSVVLSVPTALIFSEIENTLFVQKVQTLVLLTIAASAVSILIFFLLRRNAELDRKVSRRTSELEEKNRQLEAHSKMQKEFVNLAAHELRTPVQPLLVITELLEEQLKDGVDRIEIVKPEIEMMSRNAKRLERLSSDILEVSRIESDSLTLRKDEINLNEKIKNALTDAKSYIPDNKKILLVFESSKEPIWIDADTTRLYGVLSNLISNAIKFIRAEGAITISSEKSSDGTYATVSVRDTGTGIAPEILPRLFTKFATKSEQGTGLGLFICKSVIEAHGGKIWAENNDKNGGKGATFSFTVPISTWAEAVVPEQHADQVSN
ncbi:MAG TPA: sensor histidine kinase [Nitrososphaera sp.]|nr:sensor histidine kinase [Nitrososphaera sp.]